MDKDAFEKIYGKGTKLFELAWFNQNLPNESERGQALIIAAYLEDMLERTLHAFLPQHASTNFLLGGSTAPIGTFAAKISLARSLSLLTEGEYQNLHTIRKIRNKFAHTIEVSFDDQGVKAHIQNLNYALGTLDADTKTRPEGVRRFQLATSALLLHLHDRFEIIEKKKAGVTT